MHRTALPISQDAADANLGASGMLSLEIDEQTGVIYIRTVGLNSLERVIAFGETLPTTIETVRRRFGRVRVLADLREAQTQRPEVAAEGGRPSASLYREGDRVAVIVMSSLLKMQMRRILKVRYHEFFLSADAAKMWLFA